jgi:nitrite reductase/ring-hydroxylating ferredoxin subunit
VGFGFVCFGGWLGGTLVYRNQIGVDHRYADAGKWYEQDVTAGQGEHIVVAKCDELKAGQMKLLHVNDRRIVLARTDEGYCAFDDRCTHRGGPLSDGVLACKTVTCPWHGSQFDVTNGSLKAGPAEEKINTWTVEESGGEVRLKVP